MEDDNCFIASECIDHGDLPVGVVLSICIGQTMEKWLNIQIGGQARIKPYSVALYPSQSSVIFIRIRVVFTLLWSRSDASLKIIDWAKFMKLLEECPAYTLSFLLFVFRGSRVIKVNFPWTLPSKKSWCNGIDMQAWEEKTYSVYSRWHQHIDLLIWGLRSGLVGHCDTKEQLLHNSAAYLSNLQLCLHAEPKFLYANHLVAAQDFFF